MSVISHKNHGAIGHRVIVEYLDHERDGRTDEELLHDAEKVAINYCAHNDGYPRLPKDDRRRLISQALRGKPDADKVVRRFGAWVRPFNRRAEAPWNEEHRLRQAEAVTLPVTPGAVYVPGDLVTADGMIADHKTEADR